MDSEQVADGIHRIGRAHTNCYLVQDGRHLTLVDAGLPSMWEQTMRVIAGLGHAPEDVRALLLTHAHFDHIGFAARAQRTLRIPVWVHEMDAFLAAHPYRYKPERNRFLYPLRYPRSVPILLGMTRAGALNVRGVEGVRSYGQATELDVPGHPRPVFTPGHTDGHCALHFPDRDVVVTGDALVTLDPYTARTGPQVVARAATTHPDRALGALDALAATGAGVALPGHGEPWNDGIARAVEIARRQGIR